MDWAAAALLIVGLLMAARELERRVGTPEVLGGFGEVIDGDSIRLAGHEIRLKGIDAPELSQWCENQAGRRVACGVEAARALRTRLGQGAVRCAIEGRDRYGRFLARCHVGRLELNAFMVEQGHAVAFGDYEDAEASARAARRGLWAGRFERPAEWRAAHPRD